MLFFVDSDLLLAVRSVIIANVTLLCVPWEFVFDLVEDELNGRGLNLS